MAVIVTRLCGDALARKLNMYPLASTQYLYDGQPLKFAKWVDTNPYLPHFSTKRILSTDWNGWRGEHLHAKDCYAPYRECLRRAATAEMCAYG
jgi:hypothetical protein